MSIGICLAVTAQDSTFIRVHFLYGSVPKKEFRETEKPWFGGKLGGHVGIEVDSNRIVDFVPYGSFHKFAKREDFHGAFAEHSIRGFWSMFSGDPQTPKRATFVIPVSRQQKIKLDSIAAAYRKHTPYDYAFFGMRCGAAAADILGQIGILPHYSIPKTWRKTFYPKKLRKRLFQLAKENHWQVITKEGSERRNWEKD